MSQRYLYPAGLKPWSRVQAAAMIEGYDFALLDDCDNAYRFTAVVSTERIAALLNQFARFLPDESFFILEYYPDPDTFSNKRSSREEDQLAPAVFYSPYLPTATILDVIAPYLSRMIHDGFVGFGLANNRKGLEMFFSEEKFLTFFTDNHLRLCNFFKEKQIPYSDDLILPTDFGHDHLSLVGLPRKLLPAELREAGTAELDSTLYGDEIVSQLDMYEVEEGLSFFLTRKEQEQINSLIASKLHALEMDDVEFGSLLLDWSDFVTECEHTFDGDLWEYRQGLKIRDVIQMVIELAPPPLAEKITAIVDEPDAAFQQNLIDRPKRLDSPEEPKLVQERFWYQGVVRNQGSELRRDLIRHGWFQR